MQLAYQNCKIKFIKEKENICADSLSRSSLELQSKLNRKESYDKFVVELKISDKAIQMNAIISNQFDYKDHTMSTFKEKHAVWKLMRWA